MSLIIHLDLSVKWVGVDKVPHWNYNTGMNRSRVNLVCDFCKKTFEVKTSRLKTAKTCSKECFTKAMKGHRPYHFKGGRLTHRGYKYVLTKSHPSCDRDGYVPEHRLIMEASIGRFLTGTEVVHHINGNRGDNRIENLELHASQASHMQQHRKNGRYYSSSSSDSSSKQSGGLSKSPIAR